MHSYCAYGLSIHSALCLPEVIPAPPAEPDVLICLAKIDRPLPVTESGEYFHMCKEEAYFFWDTVGAFVARDGKEILVDPFPETPEQTIRLPLLGIVLAAILQQRGILGLHASAVALNGGAVGFLGRRGHGKSTIAATLYARGHALVGDDLVALDLGKADSPLVRPGIPQMKLMPDAAAAALEDDPMRLRRLIAGYEKRARGAPHGFSLRSLPLKRLYLLEEGPDVVIEQLHPHEALLSILAQSYTARVFTKFLQGTKASQHFAQCAEVAQKVPVYRLCRPKTLARLWDVAQLLEEHNQCQ
jgi:hypothetical protein